MKIAWATDLHLDSASEHAYEVFIARVREMGVDGLVVTGDISQAPRLERDLVGITTALDMPIYYVLGNHDYYNADLAYMRVLVRALRERNTRVVHLPTCAAPVALSEKCALVGVDSWCDGRVGSTHSNVLLNDWHAIQDFRVVGALLHKGARLQLLRELADAAAATLREQLHTALAAYERVVVASHIPPFREAAWHEGRLSDRDWAPWFVSKVLGDTLLAAAEAHPHRKIEVACGHTHSSGVYRPKPNLVVTTAGAIYGAPGVYGTIEG